MKALEGGETLDFSHGVEHAPGTKKQTMYK
jgi:hypothetical protein